MADVVTTVSSTIQSGATSTGSGTLFNCGGLSCLSAQVAGTFVATITWEATANDSDWVAVQAANVGTLAVSTTTSGTGLFEVPIAGFSQFRARISAYTSGSITVAVKALQNAPCSILFATTLTTNGDVAHDGADSGNPVKVGGQARSSEVTAVSNGDRANFITDLVGKQIVLPYANPENFLSGQTAGAMTGTSDTAVIAAQGAGVRIYVTSLCVTNSHATQGTEVIIKDATTELFRVYAKALDTPITLTFPTPIRLTANQALNAANGTTASNTWVSAQGYKGA